MITVSNYHVRKRKDGGTFISLTLTGGLEMVQSQSTGQWKAVVRKCQIPSNLDEAMSKIFIGTQMPGQIVRVQSEPYDIVDERTGQAITLTHSWAYMPEGATTPISISEKEIEDEETVLD